MAAAYNMWRSLSGTATTSRDNDRLTNTLLTLNNLYQTHVHPNLPEAIQPVSGMVSSTIMSSAPYLSQVIGMGRGVLSSATSLATGAQDGTALLSVGVLLITLYVGLRIMNYVRRSIFGWVWLGIKLVLLLVVVQIGLFVNSYGWESTMKNAGWVGSIAWGMLEDALNQGQNGQRKQPRGTRSRGQNNYGSGNSAYGQTRGRGQGRYV